MAKKKLKGIVWPNMPNDEYILDADKVEYSESETYSTGSVGKALSTKAEIDGYYSDMTVGDAEQLVSTVFTEDSVPYNFRTSGGAIDIGDREYDTLVGGTIAWNQMSRDLTSISAGYSETLWYPTNGTATSSNGVATLTPSARYGRLNCVIPYVANHKMLISGDLKLSNSTNASEVRLSIYGVDNTPVPEKRSCVETTEWQHLSVIVYATTASSNNRMLITDSRESNWGTIQAKNLQCFDLTQMFGSTIADYIYSLEQGTAGAGVAFFKKLFPKPYYAYNAGELMSVKALSHDMIGFNAWDEEWELGYLNGATGEKTTSTTNIRSKNYMHILPNTTYCVHVGSGTKTTFCFYDEDKQFISTVSDRVSDATFTTPANAHYALFGCLSAYGTTYKNDICINLSWDGERNGEYEPYVKRSYPLDSNLELRGIPKLSANNDLYYDGDVYEADGTVTRKYGVVDLGTLTWSYESGNYQFHSNQIDGASTASGWTTDLVCPKYIVYTGQSDTTPRIRGMNAGRVYIVDETYANNPDSLKNSLSGVYLVYPLATPTTETAEPYNEIQWVDDFGTEEYVDTRDVAVPVGHNTKYVPNLRAKLETAPDSPDADGDYVMRHSNGVNSYVSLASNATIQNIIARLEALENA